MLAFAGFHIRTVKRAVGWGRSVSTNIIFLEAEPKLLNVGAVAKKFDIPSHN